MGSQVSGVVETWVWTAASDKGHTGTLYSKNGDRAAEVGVVLFTTALGLYGGVLWSGELQGPILHETIPNTGQNTNYWLV